MARSSPVLAAEMGLLSSCHPGKKQYQRVFLDATRWLLPIIMILQESILNMTVRVAVFIQYPMW